MLSRLWWGHGSTLWLGKLSGMHDNRGGVVMHRWGHSLCHGKPIGFAKG